MVKCRTLDFLSVCTACYSLGVMFRRFAHVLENYFLLRARNIPQGGAGTWRKNVGTECRGNALEQIEKHAESCVATPANSCTIL